MKNYSEIILLNTEKEFEIVNITKKVEEIIKISGIKNGFVNVFSKHTTLAIEINEDEILLLKDIELFLKEIIPESKKYLHDNLNLRQNCPKDEPANGKGHLRTMLLETSQIIPITNYEMQFGKYQQLFAVETSGPRKREILIQVMGE